MAILTSTEYPMVRAVLNTFLTKNDVSDTVIAYDVYAPQADQHIIDRVSDAESLIGDDAERVKRAAIYYCAYLMTPSVINITTSSMTARDVNFTRSPLDIEKKMDWLKGVVDDLLAPFEENATEYVGFFSVAPMNRGGSFYE